MLESWNSLDCPDGLRDSIATFSLLLSMVFAVISA